MLLALFVLIGSKNLHAQLNSIRPAWLVTVNVAFQNSYGEISNRFGYNLSAGAGFGYKTDKNWIYTFEGNFMFGSKVKPYRNILTELIGEQERIFNQAGNYAQLNLLQRGVNFYGSVEKIIPVIQVNKNSGPILGVGTGYLAHWISFNNVGNDAPQVLDEYEKGYDRLSGGFSLKESLGYLYLSKLEGINFKVSFDLIQAFTTNYRGFNYDTGKADTKTNIDTFYSIRLNWYLPIYKKAQSNYYID